MYIRRKVFSVAIDQATGEEKLFSVNEVISEESYQRMFAKAEEEEKPKKSHKGAKIAAGATGAAALTAGGVKLADRVGKKAVAEAAHVLNNPHIGLTEKEIKHYERMLKTGEKLQKPAKGIKKIVSRVTDSKLARKAQGHAEEAGMKATEFIAKHPKAIKGTGIGLAATGLAAGGAYGAKKYLDKKKADKK